MSALAITYHEAVAHNACDDALEAMRDSDIIGGDWGTYGREKPILLTDIWDEIGETNMWWALSAAHPRTFELLVSDLAAHVHHNFDRVFPGDTRPRDAIGVVRAARAAGAADWAAGAAEWAARAAEWAADWAARAAEAPATESAWQTEHIRAVLNGERNPGEVAITYADTKETANA